MRTESSAHELTVVRDGELLPCREVLYLKGVSLTAASTIVFELYYTMPGVAGMPTEESLVAWAQAPVLQNGRMPPGERAASQTAGMHAALTSCRLIYGG